MKHYFLLIRIFIVYVIILAVFYKCRHRSTPKAEINTITIYVDSVLNNISHHPIGINLDYFMDDDNYLKPPRSTTEALKAMGVKYLRYPGGDKSDSYLFSIPPYEKSAPTITRIGKGCIDGREYVLNDDYATFNRDILDFDEFITLCHDIEAEPVLVVAADSYLKEYPDNCELTSRDQLIEHAAAWVRYANIHKKYNVKYWMIGNECWHKNNENSTAEIYARDVIDFSKAMKAIDPSIYIIPNGNSIEFFKEVITIAGDYIDHLCLSNYPIYGYKAEYATYRDTLQDLMHPVKRALTAIDRYATRTQKEKWKLIIAEYGPFDWGGNWPMINDMGHSLCNFEMTGKQLQVPEIEFSQFWNTRWIYNDSIQNSVYDALDKHGNFNAIGYTMMIWGNFLGDQMVRSTSSTHVRSFASFVPEEQRLIVYLMNMLGSSQSISLDLNGYTIESVIQAWELIGDGPDDVDPIWQKIDKLDNLSGFELKGTSISVIELQIEK